MRKAWILVSLVVMLAVGAAPVAAITWGQPDTTHTNVGAMMMVLPGWGNTPVCSGWNVSTILRQHALEFREQSACVL